jgi:tRNA uridine 5-carbamoylmethylation protein Kti12
MIKGGEYTFHFRYEPFIKQATNRAIEQALEYGFDVIVDETHIKKARREEIVKVVRDFEASYGLITDDYGKTKIIFHWFTEKERNLKFRMKDGRGYEAEKWVDVIDRMKKSFEAPTLEEGCDEIKTMNLLPGGTK